MVHTIGTALNHWTTLASRSQDFCIFDGILGPCGLFLFERCSNDPIVGLMEPPSPDGSTPKRHHCPPRLLPQRPFSLLGVGEWRGELRDHRQLLCFQASSMGRTGKSFNDLFSLNYMRWRHWDHGPSPLLPPQGAYTFFKKGGKKGVSTLFTIQNLRL